MAANFLLAWGRGEDGQIGVGDTCDQMKPHCRYRGYLACTLRKLHVVAATLLYYRVRNMLPRLWCMVMLPTPVISQKMALCTRGDAVMTAD